MIPVRVTGSRVPDSNTSLSKFNILSIISVSSPVLIGMFMLSKPSFNASYIPSSFSFLPIISKEIDNLFILLCNFWQPSKKVQKMSRFFYTILTKYYQKWLQLCKSKCKLYFLKHSFTSCPPLLINHWTVCGSPSRKIEA